MTDHSTPIPTDTPGSLWAGNPPARRLRGYLHQPLRQHRQAPVARRHRWRGSSPAAARRISWPQTWYAWRLIMPTLAKSFSVVAAEPARRRAVRQTVGRLRHLGLSPPTWPNSCTALGHERFSMFGHDIGMWTGYALAADHPNRIRTPRRRRSGNPGPVAVRDNLQSPRGQREALAFRFQPSPGTERDPRRGT